MELSKPNKKYFFFDFDGTLTENEDSFPECGRKRQVMFDLANELKSRGNRVCLFTCRGAKPLQMAIEFCKYNGLEFDFINENPVVNWGDQQSIKPFYSYLIDDRAAGFKYILELLDTKGYKEVADMLEQRKL